MASRGNVGKGSPLPKPNNIVTVPTQSSIDFFKKWCVFMRPFVPLTDRESDVVAAFFKQRWELSKHITDPAILDAVVMGDDVKKKVMEECGVSLKHFYVIFGALKEKKVIVNNILNPRLIPNIRETDHGVFQLLVLFKETETA